MLDSPPFVAGSDFSFDGKLNCTRTRGLHELALKPWPNGAKSKLVSTPNGIVK